MLLVVIAPLFIAVLAKHTEFIETIERILHFKLPIVSCSKCFTFWLTLLALSVSYEITVKSAMWFLAIAFSLAYLSMWVELIIGYLNKKYEEFYYKIYPELKETASSGKNNTEGSEAIMS